MCVFETSYTMQPSLILLAYGMEWVVSGQVIEYKDRLVGVLSCSSRDKHAH